MLRKLTKQIQDARMARDNEAIKRALKEYDEALEKCGRELTVSSVDVVWCHFVCCKRDEALELCTSDRQHDAQCTPCRMCRMGEALGCAAQCRLCPSLPCDPVLWYSVVGHG